MYNLIIHSYINLILFQFDFIYSYLILHVDARFYYILLTILKILQLWKLAVHGHLPIWKWHNWLTEARIFQCPICWGQIGWWSKMIAGNFQALGCDHSILLPLLFFLFFLSYVFPVTRWREHPLRSHLTFRQKLYIIWTLGGTINFFSYR